MDKSDLMASIEDEARPSKSRKKKRMWREIEAIKDKYKLRKELEDMDLLNEYELSNIDI